MSRVRDVISSWLVLVAMVGCTNAQRERARTIADYEYELERCHQEGKAAGWYAVYEACAKVVDRRLCVDKGVRCRDSEGRDVDEPR